MKYSILIPTRNGAKYVGFAVQSVLSQAFDDCEVIVSVNHSSDNSLEVLSSFNDPRLKILSPPKLLSMTAHFEWLLNQASGQWVTILGDDDALLPYFFKEVDQILASNPDIKALTCQGAYYYWDGCQSIHGNQAVSYEFSRYAAWHNSKWTLLKALTGHLSFADLPHIYTKGLIHSSVIKKIKECSKGQFYHELTPDIYSGVAICLSLKKYLKVETPLFWVGTSPKSTGMAIISEGQGRASDEMRLRAKEFEKMAREDGITISDKIEFSLWKLALSSVYVWSTLSCIPFKSFFKSKWVDYLVMASLVHQLKEHEKNKNEIQAKVLRESLQKQQAKLHLSSNILFLSSLLFSFIHGCSFILKPLRRLFGKPKRKALRKGLRIHSSNHEVFSTIEKASNQVARLHNTAG